MKPLLTSPIPPPAPKTLEMTPIASPTFSAGNSSRMIPKLSGKIAAPVPWSTRQATIWPRLSAAAAPRDPRPKTPSENTSIRFLP